MSVVHVMFRGNTDDFIFEDLFPAERYEQLGIAANITPTPSTVTQDQIVMALAQYYDVGIGEFVDHKIEINKNGNITVRADTVFG